MAIAITIPRLGWNMDEGRLRRLAQGTTASPSARATRCSRLEGEKATQDIEAIDAGHPADPADGAGRRRPSSPSAR